MKKTLILMLCVFTLLGCEKDKEPEEQYYTEKQQKALEILKGRFIDTQFVTAKDTIIFNEQFKKPLEFKDWSGEVKHRAIGTLTYISSFAYLIGKKEYYYIIGPEAEELILLHRGGNKDGEPAKYYDMQIKNNTEFWLYNPNITLPYKFVKK